MSAFCRRALFSLGLALLWSSHSHMLFADELCFPSGQTLNGIAIDAKTKGLIDIRAANAPLPRKGIRFCSPKGTQTAILGDNESPMIVLHNQDTFKAYAIDSASLKTIGIFAIRWQSDTSLLVITNASPVIDNTTERIDVTYLFEFSYSDASSAPELARALPFYKGRPVQK